MDATTYKVFHDAVMNLPMVKELIRKNKKLRRHNKELTAFIKLMPIFQGNNTDKPDVKKRKRVNIKEEPIYISSACYADNDVVLVNSEQKEPNIIYELEKEEAEAEAEEEEEEEVEAEAEAESEEEEEEEEEEEAEAEAEEEEEEEEEAEEEAEEEEEEGGKGGTLGSPLEEGGKGTAEQPLGSPLEEEVFEVQIKGKRYYTTDITNGAIYEILENDDPGNEVGKFINGKAKFM
jgi:flagellar biosynthesis GTPase FlhF